jgi:hypothetical protein
MSSSGLDVLPKGILWGQSPTQVSLNLKGTDPIASENDQELAEIANTICNIYERNNIHFLRSVYLKHNVD